MGELEGFEPVLLHAGGWDEILMIGVPILLFAAFRWFAIRREERRKAEREPAEPGRRS